MVYIDTLLLQCSPRDIDPNSFDDKAAAALLESFDSIRRRLLEGFETKYLESLLAKRSSGDAILNAKEKQKTKETLNYVQRLTAKIIDNLEINISNIHIRYEDSISIPDTTFAVGVTLGKLSLNTTNSAWVEGYIDRTKKNKSSSSSSSESSDDDKIHKQMKIELLSVYHDVKAKKLWSDDCGSGGGSGSIDSELWKDQMKAMIITEPSSPQDASSSSNTLQATTANNTTATTTTTTTTTEQSSICRFILTPIQHFTVRMIHDEKAPSHLPKVSVTVIAPQIAMNLDAKQYQQILAAITALSLLDR